MKVEPALEFQSGIPCTTAAIIARDDQILGGYADGSLRLFKLDDVAVVWSSNRHSQPVAVVQVHPRQRLAISASRYVI